MKMAIYFLSLFYKLSDYERKSIIRNIFFVNGVSEYSAFIKNKNIYFNLYADNVYYRYVFNLDDSEEVQKNISKYVTFFCENRIYCYFIFPCLYDSFSSCGYSFDILSKIFLVSSKKDVNVLFQQLL